MKINPLRFSLTTRFKERHIFQMLNIKSGERILDVGCGIGYLCGLAKIRGANIVGIDMSTEALRYSQSTLQGSFVCAGAGTLPFSDNQFDKIIFADVIEHVPDDNLALQEIVRVAKPTASVVVSTPELESLFTKTRLKTFLHDDDDQYQKNYREGYTTNSLCELMKQNSIDIQRVAYSNFFLSEILLGITKLAYASQRQQYNSQSDLVIISDSWMFWIYKTIIFPCFLGLGLLEDLVCRRWVKGHCLIVSGKVLK
ncbi:MAG: class I SAM-dependent methyltransferase [Candidatus Latescibacterota bacterium]|nr:class I SAM-dependent methyltransferase [Candidatus Latescibacterota bacterium]